MTDASLAYGDYVRYMEPSSDYCGRFYYCEPEEIDHTKKVWLYNERRDLGMRQKSVLTASLECVRFVSRIHRRDAVRYISPNPCYAAGVWYYEVFPDSDTCCRLYRNKDDI